MATVCGNCGSTQGPFDRLRIARLRHDEGFVIITCAHGPLDEKGIHGLGTLACLKRRAQQDFDLWGNR